MIQGLGEGMSFNVENIKIEITYGFQKCVSRVTTDLTKTSNREFMNDLFRIALDDISVSRGPE